VVGARRKRTARRPRPSTSSITDCCADGTDDVGTVTSEPPRSPHPSTQLKNFEEFIHAVWGSGVATHFALLTTESSGQYRCPRWKPRGGWGACLCLILGADDRGALRPIAKPMGQTPLGYHARRIPGADERFPANCWRGDLKLNSPGGAGRSV